MTGVDDSVQAKYRELMTRLGGLLVECVGSSGEEAPCDTCGADTDVDDLTDVHGHGALCWPCVDGMRDEIAS